MLTAFFPSVNPRITPFASYFLAFVGVAGVAEEEVVVVADEDASVCGLLQPPTTSKRTAARGRLKTGDFVMNMALNHIPLLVIMSEIDLSRFPIHLALGTRAIRQPEHTGDVEWYEAYGARIAEYGDGWLVGLHTFTSSWDTWEVHPEGDEIVACLSGRIVLHQEIDGKKTKHLLLPNDAAINPKGAWHTADIEEPSTALFITSGRGTQHRPR